VGITSTGTSAPQAAKDGGRLRTDDFQQLFAAKTEVVGDHRDRDRCGFAVNGCKIVTETDAADLVFFYLFNHLLINN
jgi:hypothetical protein